MKNLYFPLVALLLTLLSCRSNTTQQDSVTGANEYDFSQEQGDGILRMPDYNFSEQIQVQGNQYVYTIHREASDSLPLIIEEDGNRYADNIYTLTIQAGDKNVFQRHFTKKTFMSYLSKDFQQRGLLDGMMYDKSLPGFHFAISVSLPQSDMMEPLLMQVDTNGGIVIARDERGDEELEPEDEDGV